MKAMTKGELAALRDRIADEMLNAARVRHTQIDVGETFLHLMKDDAEKQAVYHEDLAQKTARTLLAALSMPLEDEPEEQP